MKIKYYSEILNKYFDTEKELLSQEKLFKEKQKRENEIDNALDKLYSLIVKFEEDYAFSSKDLSFLSKFLF